MIALLSYSMNLSASEHSTNSSTGGLQQDSLCTDSVAISYCDLRKVNAKLIELEYEKEINKNLKNIINNDSIAIMDLNTRIDNVTRTCDSKVRAAKRERNVLGGIGLGAIVLLIISLL